MESKTKFADQTRRKCSTLTPDGKWGWVVIAATFFIRLTIPSLRVSFSVVYLFLTQKDRMTNTEASLIMAVFIAMNSILSPVSTWMSSYYSHRRLVFIGILLISSGLALCSMSLSLPWLILWYGIFGGIGSSLASTNTFLITQKYLYEKRVAANFLASLGTSLSFLVMPLFIYLLIVHFSLRGTFLIWSSVIMNGLIGTMFYNPKLWRSENNVSKLSLPASSRRNLNGISHGCSDETQNSNGGSARREIDAQTDYLTNEKCADDLNNHKDNDDISLKSLPQSFEYEDRENEIYLDSQPDGQKSFTLQSTFMSVESFQTVKSTYMSMENMFASFEYIDFTGNNALSLIEEKRGKHITEESATEAISEVQESLTSGNHTAVNTEKENIPLTLCGIKFPKPHYLISFTPMRSKVFLPYCCSSVINKQVHLSYIVYLPLIATTVGCRNEVPFLLAVIAISELITKFCVSLMNHKKWMPLHYVHIIVSFVNSLSCVVLLFSDGFLPLAMASMGIGLGMGVFISIEPFLLMERFSAELLMHSYGLVLFLNGVFGLIMYPIQGCILDATESFHVLGIVMFCLALIPALMWILTSIFFIKNKMQEDNLS